MEQQIIYNTAAGIYVLVAVWYWGSVFSHVIKDPALNTVDKAGSIFLATIFAPCWLIVAILMFVSIILEDNWYDD
jgi:hypothetical protein